MSSNPRKDMFESFVLSRMVSSMCSLLGCALQFLIGKTSKNSATQVGRTQVRSPKQVAGMTIGRSTPVGGIHCSGMSADEVSTKDSERASAKLRIFLQKAL